MKRQWRAVKKSSLLLYICTLLFLKHEHLCEIPQFFEQKSCYIWAQRTASSVSSSPWAAATEVNRSTALLESSDQHSSAGPVSGGSQLFINNGNWDQPCLENSWVCPHLLQASRTGVGPKDSTGDTCEETEGKQNQVIWGKSIRLEKEQNTDINWGTRKGLIRHCGLVN